MKKLLAVILAIVMILTLASCGEKNTAQTTSAATPNTESSAENAKEGDGEHMQKLVEKFIKEEFVKPYKGEKMPQLQSPNTGDTKITMKTNMGDIVIAVYPEYAPKAVENFVGLCQKGYYDNVIFHRVVKDFMIQGGDPTGTGTAGESIWGGKFEDEYTDALHHFRGALCYAKSGPNTNGSQFYIVHCADKPQQEAEKNVYFYWMRQELQTKLDNLDPSSYSQSDLETLINGLNELLSASANVGIPDVFYNRYKGAFDAYTQVGGYPGLDYGYTVFGQVVEGMDTVDKIANVEVKKNSSGEKSSPIEKIYIISTEVGKF